MTHYLYREYLFIKHNLSLAVIAIGITVLFFLLLQWTGITNTLSSDQFKNIVWIFALIGVFLTSDQIFKEEIEQGLLADYELERLSFIALVGLRILSYFVLVILPLALTVTLFISLFTGTINPIDLGLFLCIFFLYSLVILTSSLLTHGSQQQKGLAFLIALPLIIPIFLCQIFLLSTQPELTIVQKPLTFLVGLFLFCVPCYTAMVIFCLKLAIKVE
ncbi:MAG: hypothetical protein CMM87_03785 [Rickettsiales bacterium]|nr:hypothetical protein [Rickettsiales bacterium]|tara:strand:+ start:9699 stop:10352 length:654 start_codon:yes stop_codon:yes gene_type:complete